MVAFSVWKFPRIMTKSNSRNKLRVWSSRLLNWEKACRVAFRKLTTPKTLSLVQGLTGKLSERDFQVKVGLMARPSLTTKVLRRQLTPHLRRQWMSLCSSSKSLMWELKSQRLPSPTRDRGQSRDYRVRLTVNTKVLCLIIRIRMQYRNSESNFLDPISSLAKAPISTSQRLTPCILQKKVIAIRRCKDS